MSIENIVILICCLFLSLCFIYLEFKRPLRSRLALRIIASLLAVVSIYFLLVPLILTGKVQQGNNVVVLLTEGFSPDSLPANGELITFDKTIAAKYSRAKFYSSPAALKIYNPGINNIRILGYGLKEDELDALSPINLQFHPATVNGLVKAGWDHIVNQRFSLQGLYKNSSSDKVSIKLVSFNTVLDSAVINKESDSAFFLTAQTKVAGRSLFHIAGITGRDTVFKYPVPFYSTPSLKPRVVLLTSSPDFELKYLRNWLFDNGYVASSYSPLSKGRSVSVFNNSEKVKLWPPSAAVLNNADLLIVDESSLRQLGSLAYNALGNGLGLLVTSSTTVNQPGAGAQLAAAAVSGNNFRLLLAGENTTLAPLLVDEPKVILNNSNAVALAKLGNRAVVQQSIYGMGKVSVSAVLQTYQWLLQGNKEDYGRFWSAVINNTARQNKPPLSFYTHSFFPLLNERQVIGVAATNPDSLSIGGLQLAWEQQLHQPGYWESNFWPVSTGWQEIKNGNSFASSFYVYGADDWKEARAQERIDMNQRIVYKERKTGGIFAPKNLRQERPVPESIWFLLFLVGAGYLWWERKKS